MDYGGDMSDNSGGSSGVRPRPPPPLPPKRTTNALESRSGATPPKLWLAWPTTWRLLPMMRSLATSSSTLRLRCHRPNYRRRRRRRRCCSTASRNCCRDWALYYRPTFHSDLGDVVLRGHDWGWMNWVASLVAEVAVNATCHPDVWRQYLELWCYR